MAITATTLNGAITADATLIKVTSGTSFGKGKIIKIDDEFLLQTADADAASTTLIPVKRGQNGTQAKAHVTGANVLMGSASQLTGAADFGGSQVDTQSAYPLAGRQRRILSYSAAGAVTLPSPGSDMVAVINGTNALAMTLANPTTDMDGDLLIVIANGKAAHTLTYTAGFGNGGASFDVATYSASLALGITLMACNGFWVVIGNGVLNATAATGGPLVA